MWVLTNSKQLFDNLPTNSITFVNSIKTFDFSTLYTSIPHDKLKSRLTTIVNQAFCFHFLPQGVARTTGLSHNPFKTGPL